MVSSIKINISRIHKQESKQYEQNLYGVFASVHIVSIENVGFLHWRHSILQTDIYVRTCINQANNLVAVCEMI